MKKYIDFDDDDVLKARYDSAINKVIPKTAVEVSDVLFRQTITETDGQWQIDRETGEIAKHPFPPPPPPSIEQQIVDLEAQVTPRRQREAMLTSAGKAWLGDIEAQIVNLRAQLTEQ